MYLIYFVFLFVTFLCTYVCTLEDNSITENIMSKITTKIPLPPSTLLPNTIITTSITSTTSTIPMTSTTILPNTTTLTTSTTEAAVIGCSCGIFLSGQFKKASKEPPKGNPALIHEQPETFPCTNAGNKMCTNKCLDNIVKHLPNSPNILCATMDRDCFKERAYLFIKNCKNDWMNTNLSAGREYCCKNGLPYKCPRL